MSKQGISGGVVHKLPPDLKKALTADEVALAKWEDLTPLARNEWICWVESVKTQEIRQQHVMRTVADLGKGKRRSGRGAPEGAPCGVRRSRMSTGHARQPAQPAPVDHSSPLLLDGLCSPQGQAVEPVTEVFDREKI